MPTLISKDIRENRRLKQIIGQLMLQMDRGKKIDMIRQAINKTELARSLGISRSRASSLYYQLKRLAIDEEVRRAASDSALSDHPVYGHQESFFGHLKQEGGDLNRFETNGELVEELYRMIYYYNQKRIHSKLKMPPAEYRQKYLEYLKEDIKSMP